MPEQDDFKLDQIAAALGLTISEARDWIQGSCCQPAVEVRFQGVPRGDYEVRDERGVLEALDMRAVAQLIEAVVGGESTATFSELARLCGLSATDTKLVCSKAISRRFGVSPLILQRAFVLIEYSLSSPSVGASRRAGSGDLVLADRRRKDSAKALLAKLDGAADYIRSSLGRLIDLDPLTGMPILDPALSDDPWLREIPWVAIEELFRWTTSDQRDNLLADVWGATTGSRREVEKNAAILIRWTWEHSGLDPKTRHDGVKTPYMQFGALVGDLYGLKIGHTLLESTEEQEALLGVLVGRPQPAHTRQPRSG